MYQTGILLLLDIHQSTDSIKAQTVPHKENSYIHKTYDEISQNDCPVFLWVFSEGSNRYGKCITGAGYWGKYPWSIES